MRTLSLLTAAALACTASAAADLAQVDRAIGKEPSYSTKAPRYCLLVFGPAARDRAWLVLDGDTLYVDRDGDGDLTAPGEKVAAKQKQDMFCSFEVGDLRVGGLTHTGLSVSRTLANEEWAGDPTEWRRVKASDDRPWSYHVRLTAERADDGRKLPKKIGYVINGDGLGFLIFGKSPKEAPVIHLNGPWTFGVQDWKQRLVAGHKSQLQVGVGTPGVGPGTFSWVLYKDTIPADAYPVAEVAFPAAPGKDPPTTRVVMKERC
jgi:hypothetical protein